MMLQHTGQVLPALGICWEDTQVARCSRCNQAFIALIQTKDQIDKFLMNKKLGVIINK